MIESQIIFYERAYQELINNCNIQLNKGRVKSGKRETDYKYLFLTDGTRIANILHIPDDTVTMVVSDSREFKGIQISKTNPLDDYNWV